MLARLPTAGAEMIGLAAPADRGNALFSAPHAAIRTYSLWHFLGKCVIRHEYNINRERYRCDDPLCSIIIQVARIV